MAIALGPLELKLFAWIQARGLKTVRTGDSVKVLGWNQIQERNLLSRLAFKGLIVRVRRGLYLVPSEIPLGGRWSPGVFLALATLMCDAEATYQICGPNTFSRYGWTEQMPNRVYVYNNRISGTRKIGTLHFSLIKLTEDRLGETEVVKTPEGLSIVYSSRPRSLIDAVHDWSRFNTLPRAYDWISKEISQDERITPALIKSCLRYGNQGTIRRMGRLMQQLNVAEALLRKLEKVLHPTTSIIPWIPSNPKRGTIDKRWGVVINNV